MTRASRAIRALPLWMHFVLLIGVFVIVAAASAAYIHHQTYRDAEQAAHKHARAAAHASARDLGDQIKLLRSTVLGLAANPALPAVFKDAKNCTLTTTGGHVDIVRTSGETVCSSAPIRGKRIYRAAWFLQARVAPTLAAPIRDPLDGHWSVAYAAPMPRNGGVVVAIYDLEPLAADFARKYAGGDPFLLVVHDGKRILARSIDAHDYIGRPVLKTPRTEAFYTAEDRQGVARFFAQEPIAGTTWRFVAGESRDAATAPGRELERRQFGILLVGLVLMLLATSATYAVLISPIRSMRRALSRDEAVPEGGPAELGKLAGEINALLHRQERERQAQKMEALGRLASGIAHDFNNLLVVISGGARLLIRRGQLDERDTESAERIDSAAHRGQQLTTQLLAFARQRAINPVPTDVNVTVREMTVMLDRVLGSKIQTVIELTPELPPVLIDEGQLAQVILNLAINARDAMASGGKLTISTSELDLDDEAMSVPGRYIQIEVTDTGAGMDADTAARAFDPFFTTKDDGTGLGLATVHGIVTGAAGFVNVVSEPGHGSTFRIVLPNAGLGATLITEPQEVAS